MGGLFFIAGGVAMSLRIPGSSGDLYHYFRQLRCLKRAMISFHYLPASTGTDIAPTPEQLEHRVQATLREYDRESGDYIPMLGVLAPPSRDADDYVPIPGVGDLPRDEIGYFHIHLLLQRHNRSEEKPVKDPALLTRLGRKHWLVVKVSNHPKLHNSDDETDLLEYVSGHAEQEGTQVLAGPGVRTNFSKDRSLTSAERRAAAPAEGTVARRARPTPTPQELARKQRAAEQRTRPIYRPRRTPAPKRVPVQAAQQSASRRRELAAGKRREMSNGQVVMTLPRSD